MRAIAALLVISAVALTGCGDDDDPSSASNPPAATESEPATTEPKAKEASDGSGGTEIILSDSQFGTMLYGADRQAIYIFEKDPKGKTVCYGECAAEWPPVLTEGQPRAGKGVREDLLGTVKRRDGKLQVTYAGKPLYFYAHEDPGVVLCHDVNKNGGLWWVVGPDGRRR